MAVVVVGMKFLLGDVVGVAAAWMMTAVVVAAAAVGVGGCYFEK